MNSSISQHCSVSASMCFSGSELQQEAAKVELHHPVYKPFPFSLYCSSLVSYYLYNVLQSQYSAEYDMMVGRLGLQEL